MSRPYEPQPCDKSTWGPGPWQRERDFAEWQDTTTGYNCCIARHGSNGHWCGYVECPEGHPLRGKSYSERVPAPKGLRDRQVRVDEDLNAIQLLCASLHCNEDMSEAAPELFLFVHGGLTFSQGAWFGFDCAHAGDLSPGLNATLRGMGMERESSLRLGNVYRDEAYVIGECERLAKQLWDYAQEFAPQLSAKESSMQAKSELEKLFAEVARGVKHQIAGVDIPCFTFRLEASGRTHEGELKIEVSIGEYGVEVKGGSTEAVVREFLRRKGWEEANAPLALPDYSGPTAEELATRATAEGGGGK